MNVSAEDIVLYLNNKKPHIHDSYKNYISIIDGIVIIIKNCSIIGDLNIESSFYHLNLIDVSSANNLNINIVDKDIKVLIKSSTFSEIKFSGEYDYLAIFDGTKATSLKLREFNSSMFILKDFDIFENDRTKPYYEVRFNEISISNSNVKEVLTMEGQNFCEKIHISQLKVGTFHISNRKFNEVSISGIESKSFLFQGETKKDSHIRIYGIKVKVFFRIVSFNNYGLTTIDHISTIKNSILKDRIFRFLRRKRQLLKYLNIQTKKIEPYIEFELVKFGKCEFKNFFFKEFETIFISYADLSQSSTSNSVFPSEKILLKKVNSMNVYESFNNLYSKAKSNNNRVEQAEYYKISMSALLSYNLKHNTARNLPSIITLITSKLYSNYATNWIQGIASTFIAAFISFSLMMNSTLYNIDFSLNPESIRRFWNLTPYYLQFINPTHKIDFLDQALNTNLSINSAFLFWDLTGRVLVGIGIFETIKSFRKYIRN